MSQKEIRVSYPWYDEKDNDRIYAPGDVYEGKRTKARLSTLTSNKNGVGRAVLEVPEDEPKTKTANAEAEKDVEKEG